VDALSLSSGDVDPALVAMIDDPNPAVVADVAQILGRRRTGAGLTALVQLTEHADDNVAVAAIEGLGRVGGRAVVDVLVQAVQSRNFFRTFSAIDVLGKSGDPRAVAPLASLLDDPHYSVEAARALGRTCDRAAVVPLCALLASPAEGVVRVAAVSLAELRQKYAERFATTLPIDGAVRRSAPRVATRRLMQCTSGADAAEHVAIVVVLGCLGQDIAAPALVRALDGPAPLARAAVEALQMLSSESEQHLLVALWEGDSARRQTLLPSMQRGFASDAVIACLHDDDAVVRRLACDALARMGSRRAVPDLFERLGDASVSVAQAATAAIVSLGSGEAYALAERAAASAQPAVRRAALRIVSQLGGPEALGVLAAGARDSDARVRDAAIAGLSLVDTPEAVDLALSLARDELGQIRGAALRALGDSGARDPRVAEQLRAALGDPDAWVRYYACQAVGKLKLTAEVERVAERVADPAGQVRVAAIEALSHLPGDLAFRALLDALDSADVDLQRAGLIGLGMSGRREALDVLLSHAGAADAASRLLALSALAAFEGQEPLAALATAVRDPDESVRMAALGYLGARSGAGATQILAGFLTDPALGERARAALATPQEHRLAGLASALHTADDESAAYMTGLLARLQRPEALATLFEALSWSNVAARRAAATTLGAIGSHEALAALQRLSVEDPDADMRRVCALLLVQ